jgi:beta-N-acetylhexosaminidase
MRIRPLDRARDGPGLERLWRAALAPAWPPLPGTLAGIRDGLVAEAGGRLVGAIAADAQGGAAGVALLVVAPDHQRRGIGTALLDAALARLRAAGARHVSLGSDAAAFAWPGVPADLHGAVAFFTARDWRWGDTVTDLTANLRSYTGRPGVHERVAAMGVTVSVAGTTARSEALAFERRWFPSWLPLFERGDRSVLLARDRSGAILGSLLFTGPGPSAVVWPMLGPDMGWIACVGVAEPARGSGIAGALVTRASELLRGAGAGTCLIDWARRPELYERHGYRPWRRYLTARRRLD